MSVTIDPPPEIEQSLSALAEESGVPLPVRSSRILVENVSRGMQQSPAQRAQSCRDAAMGLPDRAPLSDAAIRRHGIYGSHR